CAAQRAVAQHGVASVERNQMDYRLRVPPDLDLVGGRELRYLLWGNVLDQTHLASPQSADGRLAGSEPYLANPATLGRGHGTARSDAPFLAVSLAELLWSSRIRSSTRSDPAAKHRYDELLTNGRSGPAVATRPSIPQCAGPTGPVNQSPTLSGARFSRISTLV